MKLYLCVIMTSIILTTLYAIEPPKKGVTPPSNFAKIQEEMGKTYSEGYYAKKMNLRKLLSEKIANGEILEKKLASDTVEALVLLGKYSNSTNNYKASDLQTKLFDGPSSTGTITDYYRENSYNQLNFAGNVLGWFTVPGTQESYVGSDNGLSANESAKFIYDLIKAADSVVDYSKYIQYYDVSGNPHISVITGIHTGGDGAAGANNIWSHQWDFKVYLHQTYLTNDLDPKSGHLVIIDGNYIICPELNGNSNTVGGLTEIGVFCHEFGHVFGLPDLYDTDNSSKGLGKWCLMAYGSWGGDGSSPETPVQMCAWSKVKLGWVTPIVIDTVMDDLVIPNVEQNKVIYKIWKHHVTRSSEYFLLENRQKINFDKNLIKSGLLIFHVDESMLNNIDENHYLVDLMQADGNRDLNLNVNCGDEGDPFPGSTNNIRFDWMTNPSSIGYIPNSFVYIKDIRENSSNIIADIDNGSAPYIIASDSIFVGNVDLSSGEEIDYPFILKNYGLTDLNITDIIKPSGPFQITNNLTYPIKVVTKHSIISNIKFKPTQLGLTQGILNIKSNNPYSLNLPVYGRAYEVSSAENNTLYASSGSGNGGNILTIDPNTGTGSNVGTSSNSKLKGIAINPRTNKIYVISTSSINSEFMAIDAKEGKSYNLFSTDLGAMWSIAFDTTGCLYAAFRNGEIYSVDLKSRTLAKVCSTKIYISSIAFDPFTNVLYASVYPFEAVNKDILVKINLATGDTINVGKTGFNIATNAMAFDTEGNLFGTTGSNISNNILISIDKTTGKGSLIGALDLKDITGLSFSSSNVQSVKSNNNIGSLAGFSLSQNYPNPFNPTTTIEYSVPNNGNVKITIYNLLGQAVETLTDSYKAAGTYKLNWNASNMASGVYFYVMKGKGANGESFSQIKKMLLLK